MSTEPWIVDPVSMAPRTNTLPQPVENRSNETARTGERRCFTNHPATEVYTCCHPRACGCNGNNGALRADSSHGYGWDTENRLTRKAE